MYKMKISFCFPLLSVYTLNSTLESLPHSIVFVFFSSASTSFHLLSFYSFSFLFSSLFSSLFLIVPPPDALFRHTQRLLPLFIIPTSLHPLQNISLEISSIQSFILQCSMNSFSSFCFVHLSQFSSFNITSSHKLGTKH